jgi:hypothetical protein
LELFLKKVRKISKYKKYKVEGKGKKIECKKDGMEAKFQSWRYN